MHQHEALNIVWLWLQQHSDRFIIRVSDFKAQHSDF